MTDTDDFQVFVAADGAYAALERAVLSATTSIIAGFRLFDMRTPLISKDARAVGDTWFDLLAHVLQRGVSVDLIVSDFDPVYATELHQLAWRTVKQGAALAEVTDASSDALRVRAALHPASPGLIPWVTFLPESLRRLRQKWRRYPEPARADMPGFTRQVPDMHPVTHHQKVAVIDDHTLYIGGLDLNERRYDTPDHDQAPEQTWSDVQIMLRNDPAVAEARIHLESFEDAIAGRRAPPRLRHLRRTLSADRRFKLPFLSPRTLVSEIEDAHIDMIRAARHLIYAETQFMRSSVIADEMADAVNRNPDLSLILILPALPEEAAFPAEGRIDLQTRYGLDLEHAALRTIRDAFGDRATIASPVQPVLAAREGPETLRGSPLIYVHNKVMVQDRERAIVGSANLNGRSLRWDTELALELVDGPRIAALFEAVTDHWWHDDPGPSWRDPAQMQALWHDAIRRNAVTHPKNRSGFLVPHGTALHEEEGLSLPLVTEDIV